MQKQFLPIGLDFAKKDLRAAFLLSFLINTSDYYTQNDKDADGWFYCTADNLKERIGFTRADIQHAVTVLCAMNLLQTQKRGMPAKIYYRVNTDVAIYTNACLLENDKQVCTKTTNKFAENQQTSLHENDKLVCTNPANKFVEIQQTSLSENDSNKELIYKELNNKNKKQELKEEEGANFSNSLPTPDFSDSIKQISFSAAKLEKPENLSTKVWDYFAALCISKKKKYTKSRWGGATNYLVEGFQKFGESAILEHLENWANSKTWTSPFFSNWHEAIQKANPQAAVSNDLRNLAENNVAVTKSLFMQIKGLYAQMGSGLVPCGTSEETEKEVLKELWVELLAVTPTQPAEFEKELILIEGLLKIEKAQRQNGKITTQPKSFASWIKTKGWLLFVKAAKKAQQPAKTTPTAPQIEKPVQVAQKPTTAQISTNLGLMNVTPNYKVLGDAAEKAKAMQGKVFVWNDAELKYNNLELFRKFTGINRAILLEKRIFNITDFANYCVANFGVSVSDADKIARGMCHIIPETHEIIVTEAERAQFAPIDMSKYLTVLKSANA